MTAFRIRDFHTAFIFAVIGMTLLRVLVVLFAAPELGPDETQYWHWAQTPAWGYFSKPPLIAWAIAASTAIFGDAAWAVRLPAPLFHAGAAAFLYALTRRLYGEEAGFFVGLCWLTMPGVALSSTLIATDAPLLFFWSGALYFLFSLTKGDASHMEAALLGAFVGLGFLSKYAMIYFVIGGILCLFVWPALLARWRLAALAGGVACIFIAPNVYWNAANDFSTLSHTAANADWAGDLFKPIALAEFLGAQFGVAGPILFVLMLAAHVAAARGRVFDDGPTTRALVAFAAPAFVIVSIQSFISRAHANWAAAAYPAALILAVAFALATRRRWALNASVALHLAAFAGFALAVVSPAFADGIGAAGAFKRLRGWETQGAEIRRAAAEADVQILIADDREYLGALLYYARGPYRIEAFDSNHRIDHHYEAFLRFQPADGEDALFVTDDQTARALSGRFDRVEHIGATTVDLGGGRSRTLFLFRTEGFKG